MPARDWYREGDLLRERRLASLGVPHGVTLRSAGDMKDPASREKALRGAGLDPRLAAIPRQVHGTAVARAEDAPAEPPRADGWIGSRRGQPMGIYVADCIPMFVWDDDLRAVGVFHAGWRGVAAGMPRAAVESFSEAGIPAGRLSAAIGPRVGPCCYRVGPEVAGRFRRESVREEDGGAYVDLGADARAQLVDSGLSPDRISLCEDCTACSPRDFFSYRREKMDQRMMAFIALPA